MTFVENGRSAAAIGIVADRSGATTSTLGRSIAESVGPFTRDAGDTPSRGRSSPDPPGARSTGCAGTDRRHRSRRAPTGAADDDDEAACGFAKGDGRDVRRGHRGGARAHPRQPGVPVPHRARSRRRGRPAGVSGSAISSWRRGCRSSCGAASPTTSCWIAAARGELRQPAVLERQVRRMLADPRSRRSSTTSPGSGCSCATRGSAPIRRCSRSSTRTCAGVPARDRAVLRQPSARGSQRPRSADRRLHVRQRAAGAALRHSERLRQPLPPRHADRRRARRPARPGQRPDRHVVSDRTSPVLRGKWLLENLLGAPPPPPPPPDVPALKEKRAGGADGRCASGWSSIAQTRCARAATRDGSARLRARELRRDRPLAHRRRAPPIDASGTLPDGTTVRRPAPGCARRCWRPARSSWPPSREAADLRARPRARATRRCRRCAIVRDARGRRLPLVVARSLGIVKSVPFQMRMPAVGSETADDVRRAA